MILDKKLFCRLDEAMTSTTPIRVQPGPADSFSHEGTPSTLKEALLA